MTDPTPIITNETPDTTINITALADHILKTQTSITTLETLQQNIIQQLNQNTQDIRHIQNDTPTITPKDTTV